MVGVVVVMVALSLETMKLCTDMYLFPVPLARDVCIMDGWMDGWMAGWMNGWMDGWMDG